MGMGGGGGAQQATTTTQTQLAPEQQQLLRSVIPVAEQFVQNPPQQFPGSQIAPQNPLQGQAQQQFLDAAQGGVQGSVNAAQNASNFLLGPVLNPESNPALRAATDAAIRPIQQQFTQSVLPNIRQGAITSGQFGGSRQGIAEGIASQGFMQQVGDTSAQFQNQAFQNSLDAMARALLVSPQTANLGFLPAQGVEAVGAQRQGLEQQQLNEQVQRFFAEQTLPFAAAQDVAQLAFGIGGGSTESTSTRPGAQSNPLGGALGGAAMGAQIGSMFGPGYGTAIGAGLGGLAGLFFS